MAKLHMKYDVDTLLINLQHQLEVMLKSVSMYAN